MRRLFHVLSLTALLLLGAASAFSQVPAIGTMLENFSLPDTAGKTTSLNDLRGKNGAVLVFLSAQCPVVRGYVDRINQLAADYQAKGINFIGINSNSSESLDWVRSNVTEY